MQVKVLRTTDGKHRGGVYEVPTINYEVMLNFGMHADTITWIGDICFVRNVNYTIKLQKLGE